MSHENKMKPNVLVILFSLLTFVCLILIRPTTSARILAVVPTPSYSHQVAFHSLWRELSLRGHQLTLITTNPIKDRSLTNLTEIDLTFMYEEWQRRYNMNEMTETDAFRTLQILHEMGYELIESELQNSDVQKLIQNKNEHYDLLLVETIFPGMVAFAERFQCPLIQISSMDAATFSYYSIGNPSHPVLNPDFMLPLSGQLNFFQRLYTTTYNVAAALYYKYTIFPAQDSLINKYFGNGYPSIEEILSKTSLIFVNTDFIFHPIRPSLPNVIQIGGGTHLAKSNPLEKGLKKVLDDAKNGFIYFSLGSNIKSTALSKDVKNTFLEVFAELPYTILWKFEENFPEKPNNVYISKWFPQQEIFKHPNIRLFISQGGLQSMDEAVHNYIPIIGIPFIGDQGKNVKRIEDMGIGLGLNIKTIDKPSLKSAMLEIMENPKYRIRVKELAMLARDQPMTGLERAVWWTEYVIRHKGAKHLRSPAVDLPYYQYFLLDVIGFCLSIVLIAIYLLVKLGKLVLWLVKFILPKQKIKTQ